MLLQYTGKLTQADIEKFRTSQLVNFAHNKGLAEFTEEYCKLVDLCSPENDYWSMYGADAIKSLPKQNLIIRNYESSPGVWYFTSTESDFGLLLFSDAIYKKHFKGTSFEVVFPSNFHYSFFPGTNNIQVDYLNKHLCILLKEIIVLINAPVDILVK